MGWENWIIEKIDTLNNWIIEKIDVLNIEVGNQVKSLKGNEWNNDGMKKLIFVVICWNENYVIIIDAILNNWQYHSFVNILLNA